VNTRVQIAACAMAIAANEARAQETLGFAELRASAYPGARGDVWQLVERVRPTFETALGERTKLVATIEAGLAQGRDPLRELERAGFRPLLEASGCMFPDYENRTLRISDADDYLDVDRLYLDLYFGDVDLRLGRQALNWGSAQFFNPTDPFPEVLLAEPWRPRAGVNAVRAHVALGETTDATAVAGLNDTLDDARAAARIRTNWAETDFAVVGAWRGENDKALVGVDLRGTFEVGWWIEAAYLFGGENAHEELAIGLDYSFPILERATLFLQYYRNGAGAEEASINLACDATSLTRGRNYLVLGSALAIDLELSINLSVLHNLDDGTGIVVPTITYNVLDWLDTAFSAQAPYALRAEGGELKPKLPAELSGLVPDATLTFWTRASF
jgi:hypothetical protein